MTKLTLVSTAPAPYLCVEVNLMMMFQVQHSCNAKDSSMLYGIYSLTSGNNTNCHRLRNDHQNDNHQMIIRMMIIRMMIKMTTARDFLRQKNAIFRSLRFPWHNQNMGSK